MKTRNRILAVAAAATLGVGISASSAYAQEPTLPPPVTLTPSGMPAGETVTERVRPNRPALISGATVFGAAYVPSFIIGALSSRDADNWLYAPVIGPWVDLATRGGCNGPCGTEALYKTMLVASGIAQAYGVATMITAFVAPEKKSVPLTTGARVVPAVMGKSGYGLSLVGAF